MPFSESPKYLQTPLIKGLYAYVIYEWPPKAPEDKDAIAKNYDKTDEKDSNSIAQINDKG